MSQDNKASRYLGRAVASQRTALGMKRMDLKNASGLSYPYIAEIENGGKYPSQQALAKIAEALGMSPLELLSSADELARQDAGPPVGSSPDPDVLAMALPRTVPARPAAAVASSGDEVVDRLTSAVYAIVEPRMREWLTREIQLAVREELLRQRENQ